MKTATVVSLWNYECRGHEAMGRFRQAFSRSLQLDRQLVHAPSSTAHQRTGRAQQTDTSRLEEVTHTERQTYGARNSVAAS